MNNKIPEIENILPGKKEICLLIRNAFGEAFCHEIISEHKNTFQPANLNYPPSYRNNERQIKEDSAFSQRLFEKISQYVPDLIEIEGISEFEHGRWSLLRLNDRIRICRYHAGQYFHKHLDGVYYESDQVQSKLTFMIYLNGGNGEFEGGRTLFFPAKETDDSIGDYQPSIGDLIIFDHNLWHAGEEVSKGEKYILRSDILYRKIGREQNKNMGEFGEGHLGYIWKILKGSSGYLSAGRDKLIKIWDKEGRKIGELMGHKNSVFDMILMSEDTLVSCSRDRSIKIWKKDIQGQFKETQHLIFHESTVLGVLKWDTESFISCGADGKLNLIDIDGQLLDTIQAHDEWIWSMTRIGNRAIATIGEEGAMKIWEVNPFQLVTTRQMSYPLTAIEYDPQHSLIYVGGVYGHLAGVEVKENLRLKKAFEKKCHNGKIWVIKSDKHHVASGGEDNSVMLWKKENLEKITVYTHKNFVQDLILEEDRIVSASYDGEIKIFPVVA